MKKRLLSIVIVFTVALTTCLSFTASVSAATPSKYTWEEKTAPNYVVTIGKAKVSGKPQKGKIKYSKLDKYGRTRRVVGNITYKMVKASAGKREDFAPNSDPSGWPGYNIIETVELYNGNTYVGYFWNRSHLIADSLGGRAIKRNLVTGTRMQNVGANDGIGGMAYTERKVVNYLYKHKKVSVYYSATPVYKGSELIPRSVIVDIKSSDKKLNERVIVYNAAKGFTINYKKGMMTKDDSSSSDEDQDVDSDKDDHDPAVQTYVLNINTLKFHRPDCISVIDMSQQNKQIEETTRDDLIASGYSPCGNCNP